VRSKFKTTYKKGIFAEYYACTFLMLKGYRIVKLRYKTKVGEVDIIAKRWNVIAFIEVKFRDDLDNAIAAVTPKSQSRIRRSTEHYLLVNAHESHIVRFDVIGINKKFFIRHEKNVF